MKESWEMHIILQFLNLNRRGHLGDLDIDGIKMDLNPLVRAFKFSCLLCPAIVFLKTSKI
jgi:hypothetical protein